MAIAGVSRGFHGVDLTQQLAQLARTSRVSTLSACRGRSCTSKTGRAPARVSCGCAGVASGVGLEPSRWFRCSLERIASRHSGLHTTCRSPARASGLNLFLHSPHGRFADIPARVAQTPAPYRWITKAPGDLPPQPPANRRTGSLSRRSLDHTKGVPEGITHAVHPGRRHRGRQPREQ
jgi:hypothetical protein